MKYIVTILVLSTLLFSCKEEPVKTGETTQEPKEMQEEYFSLQDVLDEKKAIFNEKASDEKKKLYAEGIEDVIKQGVLTQAKKNGDKAPDFTLTNALGEEISLSSALQHGPVILTWYRGGWCPYCNLTLARLQEELPKFKEAGANLIALTPEVPDSSMSTAEKLELNFQVLSDLNNNVAKEYGVVFKLIPGVAEAYQNNFGLHEYNGDESNELPLAATYIIDTDGTIVYTFVDADYRNRAEPKDILEALKALK